MKTSNLAEQAARKLAPEDLHALEDYAKLRSDFRVRVMAYQEVCKVATEKPIAHR